MTTLAALILLYTPLVIADAALPPESICRDRFNAASADADQWKRAADIAGSWATRCQCEQANRLRAAWWAAWWIRWPQATLAQRRHWATELVRLTRE